MYIGTFCQGLFPKFFPRRNIMSFRFHIHFLSFFTSCLEFTLGSSGFHIKKNLIVRKPRERLRDTRNISAYWRLKCSEQHGTLHEANFGTYFQLWFPLNRSTEIMSVIILSVITWRDFRINFRHLLWRVLYHISLIKHSEYSW